MFKSVTSALVVLAALVFTGCSGPSGPGDLASLTLKPGAANALEGATVELVALGTFADGSAKDLTADATWTTSSAAIATVSKGKATTLTPGDVTITAKVKVGEIEKTATSALTVTKKVTAADVKSIAVTPASASLMAGATVQLIATGTKTDNTTVDLTSQVAWVSETPATATVSALGLARGVAAGSAKINATLGTVVGSATVTVTPKMLATLVVTPAAGVGNVGGAPVKFTATANYSDGSSADVSATATWTSSDVTKATVDSTGHATSLIPGTVTITAASDGKTGTATLFISGAVYVQSVVVTPAAGSIAAGLTQQFEANATYSDGTTANVTSQAVWTSANVAFATVNAAGLATAVAPGSSMITATLNGKSGAATLTVVPKLVTSLAISPGAATAAVGGAAVKFTATASYSDGSSADVSALAGCVWTSSTPATATVSADGSATPVALGTVTLTAAYAGKMDTATFVVNTVPLTSIVLTPAVTTLHAGQTQQYTVTANYSDGTTVNVTSAAAYTSSNPAFASIVAGGLATANAAGPATLTATYQGKSATATLTVTPTVLVSIAVTPSATSIPKGLTRQFIATGTYQDGTSAALTTGVTWASSDTTKATVAASGLATGVAAGSANITATYGAVVSPPAVLVVTAPQLNSITVTPATSTIAVGATVQLTATGTYSDGTTVNISTSVAWTSSTTARATVSGSGLVTGVAEGAAVTLTATDSTGATPVTGTAAVTVSGKTVTSIAVTPVSPPNLPKGLTRQFTATATYSDGTTGDVTSSASLSWTSSAPAIATISATGLATGVAQGNTQISATYNDSMNPSRSSTPVVQPVTQAVLQSLVLSPLLPTVQRGFSLQLTATGTYSDMSTQDVTTDASLTWSSATPASVTLSNAAGTKGVATGVAPGPSVVTATVGTITASTTITTSPAVLVSISVTPATVSVQKGTTQQLTATGTFSDGSTLPLTAGGLVTWASSSAANVTISNASGSEGLAAVLAAATPGSYTLTATRGTITGVASLTAINPVALTGIAVSLTPAVLRPGLTAQATAIGTYSDGVTITTADITSQVTWLTSSGAFAQVSNAAGSTGLVTGVGAGTAQISATLGMTTSAQVPVVVTSCAFTSLVIDSVPVSSFAIARGLTRSFTATAQYDTATGCFPSPTFYDVTELSSWNSSNSAVATVSNAAGSRGLVSASNAPVAPFAADISATYGALASGVRTVTVSSACISGIAVTPGTASIPKADVSGYSRQLAATATYSDGSSADITPSAVWSVFSGAASAGVDATGLVTSTTTAGSAVIRATAPSGSFCAAAAPSGSANVAVSSATLTGVAVTPGAATIARGADVQLTAVATFSDASTVDITAIGNWVTSQPSVASVSTGGRVGGSISNDGNSIVTANRLTFSDSADVTVIGKTLTSIAVTLDASFSCAAKAPGVKVPLLATATYSDGSTALIAPTWASSDPTKATVDSLGVVTVVAAGATNITATLGTTTSPALIFTGVAGTLTSIQVAPDPFAITRGTTRQFSATGTFGAPASGTCDLTGLVAWTAAPATHITISGSGLASASQTNSGAVSVTATRGAVASTVTGSVSGACINSLAVSPASTSVAAGNTTPLVTSTVDSTGSSAAVTAAWVSGDTNKVTVVGATGVATGVATGSATVTASFVTTAANDCTGAARTLTASSTVAVSAATLTAIAVTCTGLKQSWPVDNAIPVGLVSRCTASGTYTAGPAQDITDSVTWSSTNNAVASISNAAGSEGQVTTIAAGSTTVSAVKGTISSSISVNVNAATLTSIALTPSGASIPVGFTRQFTATGTYTLGTTNTYDLTDLATWGPATGAIATVSGAAGTKGLATAIGAGTVPVTATYQGKTGTQDFIVNTAMLSSIAVSAPSASIGLGLTQQYAATGTYSDGSTIPVTAQATWTTSSGSVASISSAGLATGVSAGGPITVTAAVGSVTGTAQLTVSAKCISAVQISPSVLALPKDVPARFTVTALYSDGSTPSDITATATIVSSNTARMGHPDATGSTTSEAAASAGPLTITATPPSNCGTAISAVSDVTIKAATLSSITVSPVGGTVPAGKTVQFSATGSYSDGTSYDITRTIGAWTTGNGAVATVSNGAASRGLVSGVTPGITSIIASKGTVSGFKNVSVITAVLNSIAIEGVVALNSCAGAWAAGPQAAPAGGYATRVRATGTFSSGAPSDVTDQLTWSSSDTAIATVSNVAGSKGLITTGATVGAATITATLGAITNTFTLNVVGGTLQMLTINRAGTDPVAVALGNTSSLNLQGRFGATDFYCITDKAAWSSSSAATATVSNAAGTIGRVQSIALGTTTVTATIGALNDTIQVTISDPTLSYIEILPAAVTLSVGATAQLVAIGHYSDATENDITYNAGTAWASTAAAVAAVDNGATAGLVRALATGTARIDACLGAICAQTGTDRRATVTVP